MNRINDNSQSVNLHGYILHTQSVIQSDQSNSLIGQLHELPPSLVDHSDYDRSIHVKTCPDKIHHPGASPACLEQSQTQTGGWFKYQLFLKMRLDGKAKQQTHLMLSMRAKSLKPDAL